MFVGDTPIALLVSICIVGFVFVAIVCFVVASIICPVHVMLLTHALPTHASPILQQLFPHVTCGVVHAFVQLLVMVSQ